MLSIRNLYFSYGMVEALRDISMTMSPGQVTCVMGRNGVGKTTLMKNIMGLLRPRGDHDHAVQPLPAAADVPTLVEDFRRTGLAVDLRVEGDLGAVSGTTGLALYRIVQESLTNVAKHAPGAGVAVELAVASDRVHVLVRNPRTDPLEPAGDEGFGTVGMEQRASLLGGTLRAGPDGDGWRVEAELPCDTSTPAPSPG